MEGKLVCQTQPANLNIIKLKDAQEERLLHCVFYGGTDTVQPNARSHTGIAAIVAFLGAELLRLAQCPLSPS